jgi:carboxypeptidase Taq
MTGEIHQLRAKLAEIDDLRNASRVLDWDQQTMMPRRGAQARADALATLERVVHAMFVDESTGRLLERARARLERDGADPDSDEARLVAVTGRRYEKARRVPSELAAEIAHAASIGQQVWAQARANDDFAAFAPYLQRNLELARRYVDCFQGLDFECPYDVLLDDYDPGMRTREVARLLERLKAGLTPLIEQLSARSVDDSCLHRRARVERQRKLVREVLELQGFEREGWRLDDAVHPFATSLGAGDVRITTRWDEDYFPMALFGAMHECGHGLYEDGIAPELRRTPLGHVESLSLHESQSRLWENFVGRSRAFAEQLAPRVMQTLSGGEGELAPEQLFRAVNRVEPSFIRVEADEATYGLHIVLRFELEQELIEGRLGVAELPEAWNARMREYLGLEVKRDSDGVLQDVHWSAGLIGYFPTYALGNMIAAQLWARAHQELPELEGQIASGELRPLREWLRDRVHRYGAKFQTAELLQRVCGGPLMAEPFLRYLQEKLSAAYGAELTPSQTQ